MLISTALLLDSIIRNSVGMYSGKIAVPPGGGGLREKNEYNLSGCPNILTIRSIRGSLLPPQWVLYNSIRKIEQIHLSRSVLQGSHC
jgi:hypothetical protein